MSMRIPLAADTVLSRAAGWRQARRPDPGREQ